MSMQSNDSRMEFKKGAPVINSAGEQVGSLDSIVLDPKNGDVTYLIVRKGAIFTEDKVVPFGMVVSAGDDGITLNDRAGDLEKLPTYQERYFVPADNDEMVGGTGAPPVYSNPMYGNPSLMPAAILASTPRPEGHTEVRTNIPPSDIVLSKGARVETRDGTHVGDIDEVLVDADTRRASHFVVAKGSLFKSRKLIPAEWVTHVDEDVVRLAINDRALERLHDYEPA
jgi:uncharacterized protein YrrD